MSEHWFEKSIEQMAEDMPGETPYEKHVQAMDLKYGNYDYSTDLRTLIQPEFSQLLNFLLEPYTSLDDSNTQVLICGVNGYLEFEPIKNFSVTGLDLSKTALKRV